MHGSYSQPYSQHRLGFAYENSHAQKKKNDPKRGRPWAGFVPHGTRVFPASEPSRGGLGQALFLTVRVFSLQVNLAGSFEVLAVLLEWVSESHLQKPPSFHRSPTGKLQEQQLDFPSALVHEKCLKVGSPPAILIVKINSPWFAVVWTLIYHDLCHHIVKMFVSQQQILIMWWRKSWQTTSCISHLRSCRPWPPSWATFRVSTLGSSTLASSSHTGALCSWSRLSRDPRWVDCAPYQSCYGPGLPWVKLCPNGRFMATSNFAWLYFQVEMGTIYRTVAMNRLLRAFHLRFDSVQRNGKYIEHILVS